MRSSTLWCLILFLCICSFASGCADQSAEGPSSEPLLSPSAVDSGNSDAKPTTADTSSKPNSTGLSQAPGVGADADVDLTKMSSTMIYGEVFQMMSNPDDYIGKTIKIRGQYNATYYEPTGKYYSYVLISDAMACCSQGIEFVWDNDSHVYPAEYPANGTEIEITGIFESYTEQGDDTLYCHLLTDDIVIVGS